MSRLVLVLHLPKTAGRSLQVAVRGNYGHGELAECYGTPHLGEWYRLWWQSMPGDQRDRLRCVSGHATSFLVPHLDRPFRMLCVLRHPVERVLSLHRFLVSRHEGRRERLSLGSRAERTPAARLARSGYALEDVFRRREEDPAAKTRLGGFFDQQARLLAAAYPDLELPRRYRRDTPAGDLAGPLELLLGRLERHCIVGIHDRLADSVEMFARELGWTRALVRHRNVGVGVRRPDDLSDEARESILAHNQLDLALYEHFAKKMEAALPRS